MRIIVFDTETTGLVPRAFGGMPNIGQLPRCPYVVQLSWVIYDTDTHTIEDVQDHVIRLPDGVRVPEEAARIHGISTGISRSRGKPMAQVLGWFREAALSCQQLVGHNISFDYQMVRIECLRNGMNIQHVIARQVEVEEDEYDSDGAVSGKTTSEVNVYIPRYCTMQNGRGVCKIKRTGTNGVYYKSPKLSELYRTLFGRTPKNAHNSVVDCMITLRCYLAMNCDVVLDLGPAVKAALSEAFQAQCYSDMSVVGLEEPEPEPESVPEPEAKASVDS